MVNRLNTVLNDKSLAKTVEKSVYNYVIDTAKEKYFKKME